MFVLPVLSALARWFGPFGFLLLTVGWAWAAGMRRSEHIRQLGLSSLHTARIEKSGQQPEQQPGVTIVGKSGRHPQPEVTIVLPVKGCRPYSEQNWRSQLGLHYNGKLEFIFVVDSLSDPACAVLRRMLQQDYQHIKARVLAAGYASSCSQKIHNQVFGIQAAGASSEFVVLLDDDVELHPHLLSSMVACMQENESLFMGTGYPFDIPPANASLATYCVLVYHLPLLIAFSIKQRTHFVWGGFIVLRLDSLRPDVYGVLTAWQDGGYSDDLTLAARCTQYGLKIAVPSYSIFPQRLDRHYSWPQYWNYLRRQLFVLDTYATEHNRSVNHTMLVIHVFICLGLLSSMLLAGLDVASMLCRFLHVTAARYGLQTNTVYEPHHMHLSTYAFLGLFALAQVSLFVMVDAVLRLLKVLSPIASDVTLKQFNWGKLWLALFTECALLPVAAVTVCCCPHITWSGVKYWKSGGKVVRVDHPLRNVPPA